MMAGAMPITVLMAGLMGAGKSAIGNAIADKALFQEGDLPTSCTQMHQLQQVTSHGVELRLVDTVGAGDPRCSNAAVMASLAQATRDAGHIHQVLAVVEGPRIAAADVAALRSLAVLVPPSENIMRHVTIVVTHFPKYAYTAVVDAARKATQAMVAEALGSGAVAPHVLFVDNGCAKGRTATRVALLAWLRACAGGGDAGFEADAGMEERVRLSTMTPAEVEAERVRVAAETEQARQEAVAVAAEAAKFAKKRVEEQAAQATALKAQEAALKSQKALAERQRNHRRGCKYCQKGKEYKCRRKHPGALN